MTGISLASTPPSLPDYQTVRAARPHRQRTQNRRRPVSESLFSYWHYKHSAQWCSHCTGGNALPAVAHAASWHASHDWMGLDARSPPCHARPPPALSTVLARRMAASGPGFNGPPPPIANVHLRHFISSRPCPAAETRSGRTGIAAARTSICISTLCASQRTQTWRRTQSAAPAAAHMQGQPLACSIPELTWDTTNIPPLGISRAKSVRLNGALELAPFAPFQGIPPTHCTWPP